jgi:hypothetical protein
MEISELTKVLVTLGCPAEKSAEMAAQLDKRARQLAALQHLLALMKQGWAAQGESSSVERRASRENGQI